jgi:hypothetical protein
MQALRVTLKNYAASPALVAQIETDLSLRDDV